MPDFDLNKKPGAWGSWEDVEALRRWSFARRTPEQRLAWLVSALQLAYQSGAIKPRRPDASDSNAECPQPPALSMHVPKSPESK
jgi:hypothetical protein